MARLPTVNSDNGNWGTILNNYLLEEHSSSGVHGLSAGLVTDVVNTQTDAGTVYTIPAPTAAGINELTLTASCELTFPVAVAGQSFTLIIKQGGSGNYLITWPDSVKWDNGIAPTLSIASGAIDIFGFFTSDGTTWYGFVSGQNMA
jgi:hypothetical protein